VLRHLKKNGLLDTASDFESKGNKTLGSLLLKLAKARYEGKRGGSSVFDLFYVIEALHNDSFVKSKAELSTEEGSKCSTLVGLVKSSGDIFVMRDLRSLISAGIIQSYDELESKSEGSKGRALLEASRLAGRKTGYMLAWTALPC